MSRCNPRLRLRRRSGRWEAQFSPIHTASRLPKWFVPPKEPEIKQISGQHKMCGEEHLGLGRRLVCWLRKIFPTHKLPDNSRKEWQTRDFSYIAEESPSVSDLRASSCWRIHRTASSYLPEPWCHVW